MTGNNKNFKTGKIRQNTETKILEAAEIEFANFGFKGASMMNIAKRADLPRPNVHYYFKNKLELYQQVVLDIVHLWNDAFNQIQPEDNPADSISAYIRAKTMYSKTNPLASKIFASEIIHGAPHLREYLDNDFKSWLSRKSAVIQSWIDQGKMDPINPLFLIFQIWGATQYYADFNTQVTTAMNKECLDDQDFEDIAEQIIRVTLKGCGIKTND